MAAHRGGTPGTRAEFCQGGDRLGTVEPGKLADLMEDIHHLRRLLLLIKAGQRVVDKRQASW
jgi:imidazolonepropionase-like amidohydrolase